MATKSTKLYFRAGTSDKVYHVTIERHGSGYIVNTKWGRRGCTLREQCLTPFPVNITIATEIYETKLNSKINRGYQHTSAFDR
jgi:predicted DNA-binding WGR domain protein